jgi:putative membrane protein
MPIVAAVAAVLAALIHAWFFVLESVQFQQPKVFRRFGLKSAEEAAIVKPMAFNQGFYNLFLAAGVAVGVGLAAGGQVAEGRAIALFACAVMLGAAIVLYVSNRRFLTAGLIQGGPPAVALAASLLA